MTGAFLFHALGWVAPVLAVVFGSRTIRIRAYELVPLGLLVQGLSLALLSAALFPRAPSGWATWGAVTAVSTGGMACVLRLALARLPSRAAPHRTNRALAGCTLGALIALADVAAIFEGQGWSFQPRLIHGGETYFRPPMNNDLYRHLVVVNSISRRAESTPFLPASRYSYQLFWHHLASLSTAPLASSLKPLTNYAIVLGHVLLVAALFFFFLLWSLYDRRPSLFRTPALALGLGVLVFTHADVFHFMKSYLLEGHPGIEADWSAPVGQFRNFSAKLIGLTAPQHALFFVFFLGYLNRRRWFAPRASEPYFFVPCLLSSPVLAGFVFPLWWVGVGLRRWNEPRVWLANAGRWAAMGVVGIAAHWALFGVNPVSLGTRPGVNRVEWLVHDLGVWASLPLLWLAGGGVLGLLALLASVKAARQGRFLPYVVAFVGGSVLFNYLFTGQELRRHFAMVATVVGSLLLVRVFPRRLGPARRAVALAALAALPLHVYFVHCYLGKITFLDPTVPWRDYFEMNRVLETKFTGRPVLAAVQPGRGIGLEKPAPMEVTTSFSIPYHTIAHVRASDAQMERFFHIVRSGDTLPYAQDLGYGLTLWGPVEERAWGERIRRRFIDGREPLAKAGAVALYPVKDRMRETPEYAHRDDPEIRAKYAEVLAAAGFPVEAMDEYENLVSGGKADFTKRIRLARLRILNNDPWGAIDLAEGVLKESPLHPEALSLRGAALARVGRVLDAVESYRSLVQVRPDDRRARNNLGLLLNQLGDYLGAEEQLRPLVDLATPAPAPGVLLNFAESLLGQQRYREAIPALERCLTTGEGPHKLQAHLSLGRAFVGLQQRERAAEHYAAALRLDPRAAPARAFFGQDVH